MVEIFWLFMAELAFFWVINLALAIYFCLKQPKRTNVFDQFKKCPKLIDGQSDQDVNNMEFSSIEVLNFCNTKK